jgi:hypothetical protein
MSPGRNPASVPRHHRPAPGAAVVTRRRPVPIPSAGSRALQVIRPGPAENLFQGPLLPTSTLPSPRAPAAQAPDPRGQGATILLYPPLQHPTRGLLHLGRPSGPLPPKTPPALDHLPSTCAACARRWSKPQHQNKTKNPALPWDSGRQPRWWELPAQARSPATQLPGSHLGKRGTPASGCPDMHCTVEQAGAAQAGEASSKPVPSSGNGAGPYCAPDPPPQVAPYQSPPLDSPLACIFQLLA